MDFLPRLMSRSGAHPSDTILNLCPHTAADGSLHLAAATPPVAYPALSGYTPLARLPMPGSEASRLLVTSGKTICAADDSNPLTPLSAPATLPGNVLCALPRGADSALVMTSAGAVETSLDASATPVLQPINCEFPPALLVARPAGTVVASIPSRTLSATPTSATLPAKDSEAIVADLVDGYTRLCGMAAANGALIQPVLARYRLVDDAGHILFTSPTVLLAADGVGQCDSSYALYSDDRRTLQSYNIDANTFRIAIEVPAVAPSLAPRVAAMEIWASPMFHPYYPGAPASVALTRADSASSPFIRVSLPGRMEGIADAYTASAHRTLRRAIARMDALEERVAVVRQPFRLSGRAMAFDWCPEADPATAAIAMRAALRKPVAYHLPRQVLMARPHTFAARAVAADATTVAWGGIDVKRYKGYPPQLFASEVDAASEWNAITAVRFADGTGVVRSSSGISPVPAKVGPILSYPAPDATQLTIIVYARGYTRRADFDLSPDPSGRMAIHITPDLRPIELPKVADGQFLDFKEPIDSFPSAIALAPADDALAPDRIADTGGAPVTALIARGGADQAWEFGRCRFVAGTDAGLYSIAVNAGRAAASVRCLHHAEAVQPCGLARTPDGQIFAITAATIHSISPTGRIAILARGTTPYTAIAFDSLRRRLWAFRADNSADVFCAEHQWDYYRRSPLPVTATAHIDGTPYAVTPGSILRLDLRTATAVDVLARFIIPAPTAATSRASMPILTIDADASALNLDIAIQGSDPDYRRPWPIITATIHGAIHSPARLRTLTRPPRTVAITLSGTTSPDLTLKSISLK